MNQLDQHIEALIFCSEQSLGLDEIAASLKLSYGWELSEEELLTSIESIRTKYADERFAFELLEIADGYQFFTKQEYHPTVNALIQHKAKKKLSVAQMETLSIIAYKQPISKSEVEHIRGVNCDYAVQKLLEKELISISGKSDGPGRPILYSTSDSFMDYFGIKSVKDLPQLKDIHLESNEIGQPSEYAESLSLEDVTPAVEETIAVATTIEASAEELVADELVADTEVREILSPEIVHGHLDEAELPVPDRRQIYLENQEGIDQNPAVEEPTREQDDLLS